jgi:hypothetical protein
MAAQEKKEEEPLRIIQARCQAELKATDDVILCCGLPEGHPLPHAITLHWPDEVSYIVR